MHAWDNQEWQRTLARTQEYLRNRIFGNGCDREMIEAWRNFYQTHQPIIKTMVAQGGVRRGDADRCAQEVWLDILLDIPKLRTPVTHDAFLYWLSQSVRATTSRLNLAAPRHRRSDPSGRDMPAPHGASRQAASAIHPRPSENWEIAGIGEIDDPRTPPLNGSSSSSDEQRIAARLFQMRIVEEQPVDDVASALDLTPGQVASLQRRMMQRILSILIEMDACHPLASKETTASGFH